MLKLKLGHQIVMTFLKPFLHPLDTLQTPNSGSGYENENFWEFSKQFQSKYDSPKNIKTFLSGVGSWENKLRKVAKNGEKLVEMV